MNMQDDFMRKAAVLIATLDDQTAEALLEQIGREQAMLLRHMLGELAPVTVDERSHIIQEFIQAGTTSEPARASDADGVEVDDSLAAKIAAAEPLVPEDEPLDKPSDQTPHEMPADSPFSFLADASPDVVGDLLAGELPQTISVVLSFLPPGRAADVLQRLPADRQSDVLQRLGHLQDTDESIVAEIVQELQNRLRRRSGSRGNPSAGLATVRAILDAASDTERQRMVEQLQQCVPEVLQEIGWDPVRHSPRPESPVNPPGTKAAGAAPVSPRPPDTNSRRIRDAEDAARFDRPGVQPAARAATGRGPQVAFEFDDLNALDDNALALVFHRANAEVALVALTGASPGLLERIRRQLPWREARELKLQIEQLGPIRLSDVELAQQRMSEVAVTLIQEGVVPPPKNRRFIIAA